jgi:NagD protein
MRPGCGATVAYLETATGARAMSIGKPSPIMMRAARKELGLATSETIMVGDTMQTDILGGVQMGYRTILVLTGTATREEISRHAFTPDMIMESVAELADPAVNLESLVPSGDPSDDSVQDLDAWRLAAS